MKPGIYDNMPIEEYHADKRIISSTGLRHAKRSSRDFIHYLITEQEKKSCFDFGNAFEVMLIDEIQGTLDAQDVIAVFDDSKRPFPLQTFGQKDNKQWKMDFEEENKDKYIINRHGEESLDTINEMIHTVLARPLLKDLLEGVHYQKSIFWIDEETGLICKTRPDVSMVNKKVLVNIKTCRDASPEFVARELRNHDYPLQACMEMEGAIKSGYVDQVDFYYWLFVQKSPPYHAELYDFDAKDIPAVHDKMNYYLHRCRKAMEQHDKTGDIALVDGFYEDADNRHSILTANLKYYQP